MKKLSIWLLDSISSVPPIKTIGPFILSPSFGPGYYDQGNGKDLGHELEFKSQIDLGLNIGKSSNLSFGYSHLSNASLGDKNPGANSYSFSLSHIF